jgi:hypothetical protein
MSFLFYGVLLFLDAFLVHLMVWRLCLPRRQTNVLLMIFVAVGVLGILMLKARPDLCLLGLAVPETLSDYLRLSFFYVAAALAYIISYSAIEADSPSLAIVLRISEAGPEGLSKRKLQELMTNEILIIPRLEDLVRDGLAVFADGKYSLTLKGDRFIGIFLFFRSLLGRGKGG